ncbi:hypothetical protein [Tardiphaga alba]|uniref:hypothetical protein n=1 Tax=Tardiphaga alba TaxID=340268 RepID=UPI002E1F36F0
MRPFSVQVGYDPKTLTLDRFKVGEPTGLMLDGSGSFDRNDVTGKLMLSAGASSLAQAINVVSPVAPRLAERLRAMPAVAGAVKFKLGLDVAKASPSSDRANASAVLDIDAPQMKGSISSKVSPTLVALRGFDVAALSGSELLWDARLTGQGGRCWRCSA